MEIHYTIIEDDVYCGVHVDRMHCGDLIFDIETWDMVKIYLSGAIIKEANLVLQSLH